MNLLSPVIPTMASINASLESYPHINLKTLDSLNYTPNITPIKPELFKANYDSYAPDLVDTLSYKKILSKYIDDLNAASLEDITQKQHNYLVDLQVHFDSEVRRINIKYNREVLKLQIENGARNSMGIEGGMIYNYKLLKQDKLLSEQELQKAIHIKLFDLSVELMDISIKHFSEIYGILPDKYETIYRVKEKERNSLIEINNLRLNSIYEYYKNSIKLNNIENENVKIEVIKRRAIFDRYKQDIRRDTQQIELSGIDSESKLVLFRIEAAKAKVLIQNQRINSFQYDKVLQSGLNYKNELNNFASQLLEFKIKINKYGLNHSIFEAKKKVTETAITTELSKQQINDIEVNTKMDKLNSEIETANIKFKSVEDNISLGFKQLTLAKEELAASVLNNKASVTKAITLLAKKYGTYKADKELNHNSTISDDSQLLETSYSRGQTILNNSKNTYINKASSMADSITKFIQTIMELNSEYDRAKIMANSNVTATLIQKVGAV